MANVSHAPNPDGIYLVYWSLDGITVDKEAIKHALVRAHQFLAVEDWAEANTPKGYSLAAIEKQYIFRDLYENQKPDAILTEIRS